MRLTSLKSRFLKILTDLIDAWCSIPERSTKAESNRPTFTSLENLSLKLRQQIKYFDDPIYTEALDIGMIYRISERGNSFVRLAMLSVYGCVKCVKLQN
jgi:hypothetical protein